MSYRTTYFHFHFQIGFPLTTHRNQINKVMSFVAANTSAHRGPSPLKKKRNLFLHWFKSYILKAVFVYNILATTYHPKPFPTPEKCFWSCIICNVHWERTFSSIFKYSSSGGSGVGAQGPGLLSLFCGKKGRNHQLKKKSRQGEQKKTVCSPTPTPLIAIKLEVWIRHWAVN